MARRALLRSGRRSKLLSVSCLLKEGTAQAWEPSSLRWFQLPNLGMLPLHTLLSHWFDQPGTSLAVVLFRGCAWSFWMGQCSRSQRYMLGLSAQPFQDPECFISSATELCKVIQCWVRLGKHNLSLFLLVRAKWDEFVYLGNAEVSFRLMDSNEGLKLFYLRSYKAVEDCLDWPELCREFL